MNNNQNQAYKNLSKQDKAAEFFMRTPAQTSTYYVQYADLVNKSKKLDYGCILDNHIPPAIPGDYIAILGRPGNKKSTLMAALAKRYALGIKDDEKKAIIYATWDESTEFIENYLSASYGGYSAADMVWGRVTKEMAIKAQLKRIEQLPSLWVWGTSIMDKKQDKPPFTASWLFKSITELYRREGIEVIALFLDFLQNIPTEGRMSKMETVMEASGQAKHLAKEIGCPVFAGVQASRKVDERPDKIPIWSDALWAAQIEIDATKQWSLMNPIKYLDGEELHNLQNGIPIEPYIVAGKPYQITSDLVILRNLKLRGGSGAGLYPFGINQDTLEIYDVSPITTQLPPPGWKIEDTL